MKNQSQIIKKYIINQMVNHPKDIVLVAAKHFNVTRTTIHRHLNTLLEEKKIIKNGTTKNSRYYLSESFNLELNYKISPELSEFHVFKNDFENIFSLMKENIYNIYAYGFTEIFNNAIEHSHGTKISVKTHYENKNFSLTITDDGIGIFKNIFNYFKLDDIRESILQLNKGKMTTDPTNHTGEGIFFTSRTFDTFEIYSNQLYFIRDNIANDWSTSSDSNLKKGSAVIMTMKDNSNKKLVDVFKKYQEPNSFAFDRTDIIVELSKIGDEILISRSQAKRITLGLEKFKYITLDFSGIKLVGQGFVDEIFRVYSNAHPELTFNYINANADVEFMIKRGFATK